MRATTRAGGGGKPAAAPARGGVSGRAAADVLEGAPPNRSGVPFSPAGSSPKTGSGRRARPGGRLRHPRLAAGIPAEQDVRRDERGNVVEQPGRSVAVDHQLADLVAAVDDRSRVPPRLVRGAGRRPEHESAILDEANSRKLDRRLRDQEL